VLGGQLLIASRLTHRDAGPAANSANHTKFVMPITHPGLTVRLNPKFAAACLGSSNPDRPARRQAHRTGAIAASANRLSAGGHAGGRTRSRDMRRFRATGYPVPSPSGSSFQL
jgi:hypothetical protein